MTNSTTDYTAFTGTFIYNICRAADTRSLGEYAVTSPGVHLLAKIATGEITTVDRATGHNRGESIVWAVSWGYVKFDGPSIRLAPMFDDAIAASRRTADEIAAYDAARAAEFALLG